MKNLCVFGVGDFAGSSAWKGLNIPSLCTISLACFNILTFYRVALVVLFPTKLDSLDSDFICKSYGSSGFLMDLDRRWSGVSGPPESPAQRTRSLRSPDFRFRMSLCGAVLDWGPEVPRRWTGVSDPPESPAQGTRNLRPQVFSAVLHLCGAPLDRGPELPRRVPGVSGLAGVSGPKDRNLRPPR